MEEMNFVRDSYYYCFFLELGSDQEGELLMR